MGSLILGVDISTKAIDLAFLPLDPTDPSAPPVEFDRLELPKFDSKRLYPDGTTQQFRSAERCMVIGRDVGDIATARPATDSPASAGWATFRQVGGALRNLVTAVWVEEPVAPNMGGATEGADAVREVYGAVLSSLDSDAHRSGIPPRPWRKIVGGFPTSIYRPETGRKSAPRAKELKATAIDLAGQWCDRYATGGSMPNVLHEHRADALLIALACRLDQWAKAPASERPAGLALPWDAEAAA